jgi:hypothetical protein
MTEIQRLAIDQTGSSSSHNKGIKLNPTTKQRLQSITKTSIRSIFYGAIGVRFHSDDHGNDSLQWGLNSEGCF